MSSTINVYHYHDDSSDKVWAIDTKLNADDRYDVWWGSRKNNTLNHKSLNWGIPPLTRIEEKERKGYVRKPDWTIKDCQLVMADDDSTVEELPPQLWYRVSKDLPQRELKGFLHDTQKNLLAVDPAEGINLQANPTYQALLDGQLSGGVELDKEGPFMVLLLFAIHRHCKKHFSTIGECFHVADDNNQILPDDYFELQSLIEQTAKAFATHHGLIALNDDYESALTASSFGHYNSLEELKPFAIALGCIEAPIDMSVIESDVKAAFF